jgi:uncharacterized protein
VPALLQRDGDEHLRAWLASENFSCLGARTALRRHVLLTANIGPMAASATTSALHACVREFIADALDDEEDFATLVVQFDGPTIGSDAEFEVLLWSQLQDLHAADVAAGHAWAAGVSSDPSHRDFAYSVAGHPFFLVGMHPGAERVSRRSPTPSLAFNSHRQFDRLKQSGVYAGLQRRIRAREVRLQGSVNLLLADFGTRPEAVQYAGRSAGDEWACPFSPRLGGAQH